jgi:DUF1680 family protein
MNRQTKNLTKNVKNKRKKEKSWIGPEASNEGFTKDYDLPNDTAYAETCASVALAFWAKRMLNLDLDGSYADVMELALYNGALSGLSRDGTTYFYQNPLESDGSHRRWDWHSCPCCTMNVSRLIASIGGYFYSTGEDVLAVHLYGGNTARVTVAGTPVTIRQETDYPWSGAIRVKVDPERPADFALKLRIPSWARTASVKLNGEATEPEKHGGYTEIRRTWRASDMVDLDLPMPVERVYANPRVKMDVGRVALKRGPLVYCLEQADNAEAPVGLMTLPRDAKIEDRERHDLFDGIITAAAEGRAADAADWDDLYRNRPPGARPAALTAIPYFLWSNRSPSAMTVWIPET